MSERKFLVLIKNKKLAIKIVCFDKVDNKNFNFCNF